MVRCYTGTDDRVPVTMLANLGMLLDKIEHEIAARFATLVGCGPTASPEVRERIALTGDLGGKATTSAMGDAIAAAV